MKKLPPSSPPPVHSTTVSTRPSQGSVEGTVANTGHVFHKTSPRSSLTRRLYGSAPLGHLVGPPVRINRSRRRRQVQGAEQYRPYRRTYDGPRTLNKSNGAPPPLCIYCAGPCESVRRIRSSDNIERAEEHWRCTNTSPCVGSDRIVVITRYPLAQYDRRS